jgi:Mrp family chromosome partitioning ATPase
MNPYEHDHHTTYERLRGSLLAWAGTKQVIMVVSAVHGEGTTTVTSRLAATMARTSIGNVLAVDLNLARPRLHEVFGVKNTAGLKEILRGRAELEDVLQPTQLSNLRVLSVGGEQALESAYEAEPGGEQVCTDATGPGGASFADSASPSSNRTWAAHRQNQIVAKHQHYVDVQYCHPSFALMREQFDFTLLDAPPLTLDPESASLARWTDGVILVIHAGKTRWEVIEQAKSKLQLAGAKLLGVVLNRRKFPIPHWLYKYL